MAAARFGADTAARLTDVLAPITDPDRLAEIGDWLVRCAELDAARSWTQLDCWSNFICLSWLEA